MAREFLDGTGRSTSHRQVRAERVPKHMHAVVLNVSPSGRSHDTPPYPMNDPQPVGAGERFGDLVGRPECLVERNRPVLQTAGQRLPVEILHDQEVDAVLAADVEDRADVGMRQRGDRLGLALEPLLQIGIGGDVLGQIG